MSRQSSNKKKLTKQQQEEYKGKEQLTEDELKDLKECFDLFDERKTGKIGVKKLTRALEAVGQDPKQNRVVSKMLEDMTELNTAVDFDTFVDIITNRIGDTKTKQGIERIFQLYDDNESGFIEFDNIKKIAKEIGEDIPDKELKQMMHYVHVLNRTDQPDQINPEEFYSIMTQNNNYI